MESLVNQIDKGTIDCAGITGLRKPGIHCIKVLAPYVIETEVHYYSSSTPRKHVFKTLQVEQTTTPETVSIDAVTAGQWLLVEYEGEFFPSCTLCLFRNRKCSYSVSGKAIRSFRTTGFGEGTNFSFV